MVQEPVLDLVVVGAGMRGLYQGLWFRRQNPDAAFAVVDRLPQPGGTLRTQRSNGFSCELGAFAFARTELEPLLSLLPNPPRIVEQLEGSHSGWLWTGERMEPVGVDPAPVAFASGNEELAQACRRELAANLRLGRAATEVRPTDSGFCVTLGGEVEGRLMARQVRLCVPPGEAAKLLAELDPGLADAAQRTRRAEAAFVFFGGYEADLPELTGYGILPAEGVATPVAEVIYCSQVFPRRALPGQALVRVEVGGSWLEGDDAAVAAAAEAELRAWTGCRGRFHFTKVHRFSTEVADGASAECRARVDGLAARAPGLLTTWGGNC
jgi:protoporphyrinogen oxidase